MSSNHEQSKALHGIGSSSSRGIKRTAEPHKTPHLYDIQDSNFSWKKEPTPIVTASTPRPNSVWNPYNSSRSSNGGNVSRSHGSNPTANMVVTSEPSQKPSKRVKTAAAGHDGPQKRLQSKYYSNERNNRESLSMERRAIPSTIQVGTSRMRWAPGGLDLRGDMQSTHTKVAPPFSKPKTPSENVIQIDDSESEVDLGILVPRALPGSENGDELDIINQPIDQPEIFASLPLTSNQSGTPSTSRTRNLRDTSPNHSPRRTVSPLPHTSNIPKQVRRIAKDGASTRRLESKFREHMQQEPITSAREMSSSPLSSPPPLPEREQEDNYESEEIEDADGFPGMAMVSSSRDNDMRRSQSLFPKPSTSTKPVLQHGHVKQMADEIENRSKTGSKFIPDLKQVGTQNTRVGKMKGKRSSTNSSKQLQAAINKRGVSSRDTLATAQTSYAQNFALPVELCIWGNHKYQTDKDALQPDYWFYWNQEASDLRLYSHPLMDSEIMSRGKSVHSIKLSYLENSLITVSDARDFHLIVIKFEDNFSAGLPDDISAKGLVFRFLSRHSNITKWDPLCSSMKALLAKKGRKLEIVKGNGATACYQAALQSVEDIEPKMRKGRGESTDMVVNPSADIAVVDDTNSAVQKKKQTRPKPAYGKNQDIAHMLTEGSLRRSSRLSTEGSKQEQEDPPPNLDELILVYPPSGQGAVNITNGDLRRLCPSEFLNDTLIELGLKFWLNDLRGKQPELADSIHVFSSFFFKKLASKNNKNPEDGHKSVRKWTAKVDIFKKKYIIVPINENMHWYLAIIYHPEHILEPALPKSLRRSSKRVSNAAMNKRSVPSTNDAEPVEVDTRPENAGFRDDTVETMASAPAAKENDSEAEAEVEHLINDGEQSVVKRFSSCSLDESQTVRPVATDGYDSDSVQRQQGCASAMQSIDYNDTMVVDEAQDGKVLANSAVVEDSLSEDSEDEEIDQLDEDDAPSTHRTDEYDTSTPLPSRIDVPEPSESYPDDSTTLMDIDDEPSTDGSLRYPSVDESANNQVKENAQGSHHAIGPRDEQCQVLSAVPPTNFYGSLSGRSIKTYERKRHTTDSFSAQTNQEDIIQHTTDSFLAQINQEDESDELNILAGPERERSEITGYSGTIIFCMDSLGGKHKPALKRLDEYLQEEAKDKKGVANPSSAKIEMALVPYQPNFCDCGLYLLHFAQTFISDSEKYKTAILNQGKKLPSNDRKALWHDEQVGTMRERMKERILAESTEWKKLKAEKEQKELEARGSAGPSNQPIQVEQSDDEIEVSEVRRVAPSPKKKAKKARPRPTPAARLR